MRRVWFTSVCVVLTLLLTVPIYGATKKEIVQEMVQYTGDIIDSLHVPLSPNKELDWSLWEMVTVSQREATSEEIDKAKKNIFNYLISILLKERPEVLTRSQVEFKKSLKDFLTWEWTDPSSELNDYKFSGKINKSNLEDMFAKYDEAYDKELEEKGMDLSKSKEQYVMELVSYTRVMYDALRLQYIYNDNVSYTKEDIDIAIEDAISKIEEELRNHSQLILASSVNELKKKINKYGRFQSNYIKEPSPVEILNPDNTCSSVIDDIKATMTYYEEGKPSTWAEDTVNRGIEEKFIPEHLQSNYQQSITRQEFAELFVYAIFADFNMHINKRDKDYKEVLGYEEMTPSVFLDYVSTTEYFTDTDNEYVRVANMLGIINGTGNNLFNPDGLITREQVAVMLNNYYQTQGLIGTSAHRELDDLDEASSWAKESIGFVYGRYMKGTKEYKANYDNGPVTVTQYGHFDTKGLLTREQAMITIYNAQWLNDSKHALLIGGYIPANPMMLKSRVEIHGDEIRLKGTGFDYSSYMNEWLMDSLFYKCRTGALLEYATERFEAMYMQPPGILVTNQSMYNRDVIDSILEGEQTFFDYGSFTIEHNRDGYLAIFTKKTKGNIYYGVTYDQEMNEVPIRVLNHKIDDFLAYNFSNEVDTVINQIIAEAIQPGMSDLDKVYAIKKRMDQHGYYWHISEIFWNSSGNSNMHSAYNALVEKFANQQGWFRAYNMIYKKLGFDTNPEDGTPVYEASYLNKKRYTIPVLVDGEWRQIKFLPNLYGESVRKKANIK